MRWVFPTSKQPIRLKKIAAYGRSSWKTTNLHVSLQQPTGGKQVQVVVSNGVLLGASEHDVALARSWNASKPIALKVRYSRQGPKKQTALCCVSSFPNKR